MSETADPSVSAPKPRTRARRAAFAIVVLVVSAFGGIAAGRWAAHLAARTLFADPSTENPRVEVEPAEWDFGVVPGGSRLKHEFVFRNTGGRRLVLRALTACCGQAAKDNPTILIEPGRSTTITMELNTPRTSGRFIQFAKFYTSDPERREFTVRLCATVQRSAAPADRSAQGDAPPAAPSKSGEPSHSKGLRAGRPEHKRQEPGQASPLLSVTIRNTSGGAIRFRIREAANDAPTLETTLAADERHSLRSRHGVWVTLPQNDREPVVYLSPGGRYSLRRSPDGQLRVTGAAADEDATDLSPFHATPPSVIRKMLELAGTTDMDLLYDLGCGDGGIVITAAKEHGARGVGVDVDPKLIQKANEAAVRENVAKFVRFRVEDAMHTNVSDATVVTLYLLPDGNERLRPRLEQMLRPGARVVAHQYPVANWRPAQTMTVPWDDAVHTLYLYVR